MAPLGVLLLVLCALYLLDAVDLDLRLHGRRCALVRGGQVCGLLGSLSIAVLLLGQS